LGFNRRGGRRRSGNRGKNSGLGILERALQQAIPGGGAPSLLKNSSRGARNLKGERRGEEMGDNLVGPGNQVALCRGERCAE